MKRRPNRAQRRKTAVEEAIEAVRKKAYADGEAYGHRTGVSDGKSIVAGTILNEFRAIAEGSVEIKTAPSIDAALHHLMGLLKDWVTPYSVATAHAKNASLRQGAVIAPHPGFPLPITVEVALHNTEPDLQVVTAILHRAGNPNMATLMMQSRLMPMLSGHGFDGTHGLMRRDNLARGDEPDMIQEAFREVVGQLLKEIADEYVRMHVGQFNQLLRRRRV